MMASSTSQIGNFPQDSHTCSPVSPSTVTETQCAHLLFQLPSPGLYPQQECCFRASDSELTRQRWRHGLYGHEPAVHDIFDGFQIGNNSEGSVFASHSSPFACSQDTYFPYTNFKYEESEAVAPLNHHSRQLLGFFDQCGAYMAEDDLLSSGFQEHPARTVVAAEGSVASSSRPSSFSTSEGRSAVDNGYPRSSVLDSSAGMPDMPYNDISPLSGMTSPSDEHTKRDFRENDDGNSVGPVRSKKQRTGKGRERVRIQLAPDQPPTTQGKPRERVYVACQQCRSRKIRCDGAKPMCYNCTQRGTGICEFDPLPKRRGPDRQPGARQRHGKVPGPRRRRPTRIHKEEVLVHRQGDMPYSSTHSISEPIVVQSNDQNSTWTRLSSPPSSSSTNGQQYGQVSPGSPGSNTSQVPDYRSLLTPSFAYNAPLEGHVGIVRPEHDAPAIVSGISTDSSVYSSSAVLSGALSLETPSSLPYSAFPHSFATRADAYANVPSAISNESVSPIPDSLPKLDSLVSPMSAPFCDYTPRGVNSAQSASTVQELAIPSAYTGITHFTSQPSDGTDFLTVSGTHSTHARQDSLGNVTSDSYNPYQWAVNQGQGQNIYGAYISPSEDEESALSYDFTITQTPSLEFVRKTWWDSLLDTYCSDLSYTPAIAAHYGKIYGAEAVVPAGSPAAGPTRLRIAQLVMRDLQSTFRDSLFWFSFFNVPLFFGTFFRARETMQPALVLALLMWANYMRSSVIELASEGMRRTIWLKETAQAALDASVNASWIDPGLAQAAWLIALFEISSHPQRSVARLHSALGTLDNIIRVLSLTFIDAQDPSMTLPSDSCSSSSLRTSTLTNGGVSHILPLPLYNRPTIAGGRNKLRYSSQLLQYQPSHATSLGPLRGTTAVQLSTESATCICHDLSLGKNWPEAKDHVPFWQYAPAWKPTWTDAEIRREECRRLCWNTLHLFAGYTTYRTSLGLNHLDLFLLHPSNVLNIFPGENLIDLLPTSSPVSKLDTVWALYARAILLWHACLRIRNVSERERAIFAQCVWLEADAIENALDGHSCGTERAFLYHGREYLFNARMYVSSEFRRFVPHPSPDMSGAVHRRKAEEWLTHQATLAKRCMHNFQALTGMRGTLMAKRPFFCYWFMGHISRCLQLWQADKSMSIALEVAKTFLLPINYLSALWPCEDQRMSYARLHQSLENACLEAGLAPPAALDLSFPLPTNLL